MSVELARPSWKLPPPERTEGQPFARLPRPSDGQKRALWQDYSSGQPGRVPVTLEMNNRIFVLDRRFNTERLMYEQVFNDSEAMLFAQLRAQYVARRRYHWFCDRPTRLPERWEIAAHFQNVHEAAAFGSEIEFQENDVPRTRPILTDRNKHAVFDVGIDHPLKLGVYQRGVEMTARMQAAATGKTFFGRPIAVLPYVELGSDGPLTVAMNLRGSAILTDMLRDPGYVHRLFDFIVTAAISRRQAFLAYWSLPEPDSIVFADDSVALISVAHYRRFVLPHHRKWYETLDPQRAKTRAIHLCGDATRHFATIREELGVRSFDTGFPVDLAAIRRDLGPDVEILGGVEVPLLISGSPDDVYERAREILLSGVTHGRRFILREANNLPPGVPWANLAAMYKAAFDFGRYE